MSKSMFPQLIAGPIVRYSEIAKDIDSRPVAIDDLMDESRQFSLGLGQKVLIANVLAVLADQIFALPLTNRYKYEELPTFAAGATGAPMASSDDRLASGPRVGRNRRR
jgi:D-alanyl-lipoteichoic acid acyltransferase DltB (MBOAT superfamily)